jgi:hypothetical protein
VLLLLLVVAHKKRFCSGERERGRVGRLTMMAFFKSLTLLLLLLAIVQGKPNQDYYGDQANEYGDYNYDEVTV